MDEQVYYEVVNWLLNFIFDRATFLALCVTAIIALTVSLIKEPNEKPRVVPDQTNPSKTDKEVLQEFVQPSVTSGEVAISEAQPSDPQHSGTVYCEECGGKISKRLSSCPHCGCPVRKKVQCADCSATFDAELKACPDCGGPV